MKWQPIETAPKDGTLILVSGWDYGKENTNRHITVAGWRGTGQWWEGIPDPVNEEISGNTQLAHLTHWMPLPEPPQNFSGDIGHE